MARDRKALIVGIDFYEHGDNLSGCVNDARSVQQVLERNGDKDETVNFGIELLTARNSKSAITRTDLKEKIRELFADDNEIALLYFAGHGYIESTGGYILASDAQEGDSGVPLVEVLTLANASPARNKVIVLDSCNSGIAGNPPTNDQAAHLSEGLTILTASTKSQYSSEENGSGVFTDLFVDALEGAAANLVGAITPGSVYAHIDQSLGPWKQRPVFKTNVKSFVSLRKVQPPITLSELRRISDLFPDAEASVELDPSFEPTSENPDPTNTEKFAILQKYNRVNLVIPVDADHMYYAAMDSKSCRLTPLGEHYRRLVERDRI